MNICVEEMLRREDVIRKIAQLLYPSHIYEESFYYGPGNGHCSLKIGRPFFEKSPKEMKRLLPLPPFLEWLMGTYQVPCVISVLEFRRIKAADKKRSAETCPSGESVVFYIDQKESSLILQHNGVEIRVQLGADSAICLYDTGEMGLGCHLFDFRSSILEKAAMLKELERLNPGMAR